MWNDGVTKELSDFLENLHDVGKIAIDSVKAQVDEESDKLVAALDSSTPEGKTGGLRASLKKEQITDRQNWYGHRITYEGENEQGIPYQKIANSLNAGRSGKPGTRFISKAIRKLKGMDSRINTRFQDEIKKRR